MSSERTRSHHRVLFEVTSDQLETWKGILNNVENLRIAFGHDVTDTEVVVHGHALGFVLRAANDLEQRIGRLISAGVRFAACENTMRKRGVAASDLLEGVETVDSGVAEVVRKQEAGWSYIKGDS